ncbi:MAG TPA: patatin-like phospholipase family protein [Candidatus Dormibacteraeota bacterium]
MAVRVQATSTQASSGAAQQGRLRRSGGGEGPASRFRLVLSAGGTMGAYWMIGALQALDEAGLDPRSAEVIVGTSAGAALGAILACGHHPWLPNEGRRAPLFDIGPATETDGGRWRDVRPPLRLLRGGLLPPYDVGIPALFGGLMPGGRFLTDHIERLIWHSVDTAPGPIHRGLKVVAVDRQSGRRMVFGSRPAERLPYAVAASCAIPSWFAPVRIGSRTYIDGGVHSVFNLDLALEGRLAPVIVLSALSGSVPLSFGPGWLAMRVFRGTVGVQLGRAVGSARRAGFPVDVIEPGSDETLAMGRDLMNSEDAELAYRIGLIRTRQRLRSARWQERLGRLTLAETAAS